MDVTPDRGIFATATPEQFRAMAAYAGDDRLCRQTVTVEVAGLGSYSFDAFPTTIDGAMAWFADARGRTPPDYRHGLRVDLSYERGRYDEGDSASLTVCYDRPETDDEMKARFDNYMAYVNGAEAAAWRAYHDALRSHQKAKSS